MDIGKSIQKSIDLYTKNFGPLFLAGLIAGLLSSITLGILAGPLMAGFVVLCLKFIRGGKGEFSEIFAFDKFGPTFLVMVIIMLPYLILSMIPFLGALIGLVIGPFISLLVVSALAQVMENNAAPVDAVKKGFEIIKSSNNLPMVWVYCLVMGIISAVGAIACGIGILATMPLGTIGMAMLYEELTNTTTIDTTTVNTGA